jgi:MraZ protein
MAARTNRPESRGSSHSATPAEFAPDPTGAESRKTVAFRGHFEYSLDAKNRLTIPAKFRASFSDGLVLARWLDPCVAIFTPEGFDHFNDSFIGDTHPLSQERRKLTRFFSGGSFDVELDSAGRVTLNSPLLAHGRIAKDVVVIGNVDHLEVWDRALYAQDQTDLPDHVARIAESLGHPS